MVSPRKRAKRIGHDEQVVWRRDVWITISESRAQVSFDYQGATELMSTNKIRADASLLPRSFFLAYEREPRCDPSCPLKDGRCELNPFRCTLIKMPLIRETRQDGGADTSFERLATPEEKLVLACILLDATRQSLQRLGGWEHQEEPKEPHADDWLRTADASGALPIHSLLLSNDPFALLIAYHVFKLRPGLMPIAHVPPHTGLRNLGEHEREPSVFEGENCMHIAIINRREALACRMLHLAYDQKLPHALLDNISLQRLCLSQARGAFFALTSGKEKKPLACYGGTPLAYCAANGLHRALKKMLDEGERRFPEKKGYLFSTHCAGRQKIAYGKRSTIDFLWEIEPRLRAMQATSGFDGASRFAYLHILTCAPKQDALRLLRCPPESTAAELRQAKRRLESYAGLSPLQLAVKIGNQSMYKHLLRKQTQRLWDFGPLRGYRISLECIDTLHGGSDVMALVTRSDAVLEAQELLGEKCMQGFLFKLFVYKWDKYGRVLLLVQKRPCCWHTRQRGSGGAAQSATVVKGCTAPSSDAILLEPPQVVHYLILSLDVAHLLALGVLAFTPTPVS